MRLKRIFSMAWENMKQRKLRTFLTTLGVVIGITAIIALSSLGEGFRVSVTERMERGFELDVLTVQPGTLFGVGRGERFRDADVEAVKNVANISVATPVMQIGSVKLYKEVSPFKLYKEYKNVTAFIGAAVNFTEFAEMVFPDRFIFEEGGIPEQIENDTLIIGYKVNHPNETEAAFAHPNDKVTMTMSVPVMTDPPSTGFKNYSFTVAGTLEKTGAVGFTNFDYWVFIPLETARNIYGNVTDLIYVKVLDPDFSEDVAEDIEDLFTSYQITVFVPLSFIRQVNSIINIINIFLTSIASIALLVAGIGIMNIMTVSVMERTREIGILKAVGAKNRTILTMFLAEAALIGLVGSLIGVPTGYGISTILSHILSGYGRMGFQPEAERATVLPVFSWDWVVIAVVFGIVICILFGLYPARKAAKLDPVEALRYE